MYTQVSLFFAGCECTCSPFSNKIDVFEYQQLTLWLQCGAFWSKSDTLAAEVLQKIKIDNTSNARASVFNRMGPGSHQNQNSCKSVTGAAVRRILAQKNDSRA